MTEVVLLGNDLYYVGFYDDGNLQGHFTQINEHIVDGKIVEAAGFYKLPADTALKAGQFSAELVVSSNTVNTMTRLIIESTAGAGSESMMAGGAFDKVTNITDISAMNDEWSAKADFSEFNIDAGLNLTAVDKNNCKISSILTLQDNDVFAASFNYADCDAAGQYDGVLWSYSFDGVTYLKWFALDSNNNAVIGMLDDFTSHQDSLALTGELKPAFYADSSARWLISKGNKIYYRNSNVGSKYVFTYPAPATVAVLESAGEGFRSSDTKLDVSLSMPVPNRKSHKLGGEIVFSNDSTESFFGMEQLAESSLFATVAGSWSGMTIAENGAVSGSVAGCSISGGAVTNYIASIADMQLTLAGCAGAGDYSGVVVGAEVSNGDAIFLNLFRESGGSVVGGLDGSLLRN
ncbi:MAG: hypothetical protein CVV11_10610 [Gammaproteobacteria bacterium HGW-Gammaproteobacteria-15]|nr:MAG: hypothetical protein CVV11_10610 [Gammaproteobacteria bacterium HGW-Gammaproteobacteria-15]